MTVSHVRRQGNRVATLGHGAAEPRVWRDASPARSCSGMATAAPRSREVTAGLPVLCMLMIWGCDLCLVQLLLVQLHLVCGITQLLTTVLWDSNSITCTVFFERKT
jgi:hypothetical protein